MDKNIYSIFFSFICFTILFFFQTPIQAQDPYFSQYFTNKIQLNPAFTGYDRGIMFSSITRNQWYGLEGGNPFLTSSVELGFELPKLLSGIGLQYQINKEGAGNLNWNKAGFSYAFRNRNCAAIHESVEFALGFSASFNWFSIDYSKLVFRSMLHPLDGQIIDRPPEDLFDFAQDTYFDLDAGAMMKIQPTKDGDHLILGFSLHHLPGRGGFVSVVNQNALRLSFHGSFEQGQVFNQSGLYFSPTFRADIQSASAHWASAGYRSFFSQVGGVMTKAIDKKAEKRVWLGAWHRGNVFKQGNIHSILLGIGYRGVQGTGRNKPYWQVGFTYDYNLNGILNDGKGTIEVFITYNLVNTPYSRCGKLVPCSTI